MATDISSDYNDAKQLLKISRQCKQILKKDKLKIAADTGYYSGTNIKACIDENITVYVPPQKNKKQQKKGLFEYSKFHYDTNRDVYICPNNQELKKALYTQKRGDRINLVYRGTSSMCKSCALRDKCLPKKTAKICCLFVCILY